MNKQTLLLRQSPAGIEIAANILRNGGLCAIPTETVYGLAANALDGAAVANIFKAKGRPQDNPLIVHIAETGQIRPLVASFPPRAQFLAEKFWPGPLTMILPKSTVIPDEVSAGLETVAIRLPSHPTAREIIARAGVPLAAPSANRSGSPSPTTAQHVMQDMDGRIDAVVDGGDCTIGVESTVITLLPDTPRLLRPGAITVEMLRNAIGNITVDPAVLSKIDDGVKVASPGMKYKHYAPKAKVIIIDGSLSSYIKYINAHKAEGNFALCFKGEEKLLSMSIPCVTFGYADKPATQSARLFKALRELDEKGAAVVYARCPSQNGLSLSVYNRLLRAAGFEVVKL